MIWASLGIIFLQLDMSLDRMVVTEIQSESSEVKYTTDDYTSTIVK